MYNFTLTKETKEKMEKPLSNIKKGALRTQKLKELAESGRLAMIKNRADLAEAVGYPYSQRNTAGYQWADYKIKKGVLKETLTGYTNDGRAEYEYEFVDKATMPPVKTTKIKKPEPDYNDINAGYPDIMDERIGEPTVLATTSVVTIYNGDTTISLENLDGNTIVEIIKSIMLK